MEMFFENGRLKALVQRRCIVIQGRNLYSLYPIGLAAITNCGNFVTLSFINSPAIIIYQWNGARWQTVHDEDAPACVVRLVWQNAEYPQLPQLLISLADGQSQILSLWNDAWIAHPAWKA